MVRFATRIIVEIMNMNNTIHFFILLLHISHNIIFIDNRIIYHCRLFACSSFILRMVGLVPPGKMAGNHKHSVRHFSLHYTDS